MGETTFRRSVRHTRNGLQPLVHLTFVYGLKQIVSAIFRIQLERVRAFVVDKLSCSGVDYIDDKGRLAGRGEVKLGRRSLEHYRRYICSKSA